MKIKLKKHGRRQIRVAMSAKEKGQCHAEAESGALGSTTMYGKRMRIVPITLNTGANLVAISGEPKCLINQNRFNMAIIEIVYDAKCKHCANRRTHYEGKRKLTRCARLGVDNLQSTTPNGWPVTLRTKACPEFKHYGT